MKTKAFLILQVLLLLACAAALAEKDTPYAVRMEQTTSGRGSEYVTELSDSWKFGSKGEDASDPAIDDSAWPTVNLPHTWNILDGADGGTYERTTYWYRKKIRLDPLPGNKRVYLEFLAANQRTDLYVNGYHMVMSGSTQYAHKGGYTAFRYEITRWLQPGENTLAVKVDNRHSEEIAPISGDFNMYGGLYRRVYLIVVDDVHVDLSNYGSCGLFLTTPNIRSLERPADLGTLNIRADIVNQGSTDRTVTATAHIDGDGAPADVTRELLIPAGGSVQFNEDVFIEDVHLWKGIDYSGKTDNSDAGYRYRVTFTLSEGARAVDAVSDHVGFRYFYVDKETGFYLNGESYPLRGVNRHQFMEGMGSAIKEMHHADDLAFIMEMGANSIRLCHYPQTDYFYELCDRNGIIVWTEIPVVDAIGRSEYFLDVTKTQLTELIRQQYNRPCICFWGLENEVANNTRNEFYTAKEFFHELDGLAHAEDPTGRYTTQAVNQDMAMDANDPANLENVRGEIGWKSDLFAWNLYPGWYPQFKGTLEELTAEKAAGDSRPLALSEYGWGASAEQHELYPELGNNNLYAAGKWHPEEYQSMMHEQAIAFINSQQYLYATYVWAMFDFDVDDRDEGAEIAQNDKGLVTNDRQTKKDSFYLYKANWNKLTPFVYITSSRFKVRKAAETYVKVYSNCDSVELYLNGEPIGPMENRGNGVFMVENLNLVVGENKLYAVGVMDGETYDDTCVWTRAALSTADLESDTLRVNEATRTVMLSYAMPLGTLREVLRSVDNARYTVYSGGQPVTDENALVTAGMTASVVSENGSASKDYAFAPENLFWGKTVRATSNQDGNEPKKAVDENSKSRWVASSEAYPQSVTVDLDKEYDLDALSVDWYAKNDRYYAYTIEVSLDGSKYTLAADRRNNEVTGTTTDYLRGTRARYVRIKIYGCSRDAGYASLYEMRLSGSLFDAREYEMDYDNRLIVVPDLSALTVEEFSSRFSAIGNCGITLRTDGAYIHEGDQLVLTDPQGRQSAFTVTRGRVAYRYVTEIARYKPVLFSSEEGFSRGNTRDTHAYNVNDGSAETCWVAEMDPDAPYPAWIGVDLGRDYYLFGIELQFETKGGRVYQYQVYALPDGDVDWDGDFFSDGALLIDESLNSVYDNGCYSFETKGEKARYVVVKVLGNTLYPENQDAAASLYELQVYGTTYKP